MGSQELPRRQICHCTDLRARMLHHRLKAVAGAVLLCLLQHLSRHKRLAREHRLPYLGLK